MSQPVPPPSGNPFAGVPYAPVPPPAPVRDNVGLGLVTAVVVALVAGGAYGGISGALEREIGWAAIGVGFLIGFATGKVGGRNPALPVVSVICALVAVYLGQLLGIAMVAADVWKTSVTDVLMDDFSMVTDTWDKTKSFMTFLYFALAGFAAFSGAKKAAE
ncbi:hypothetical protein OG883_02575 [Streptomyces sp. NBC_01142]|uniref:hypothetical protein n=1 Tax=Streptomyces sp. NBC_01142 TaxID=2975865 RepID=UPI002259F707|nr:hypothetical protein [Streptomyces sp. NBC_01142]MCX4818803.1 hypothetical protein [Streptomyces sp. NBC_01142]